MKAKWKALTKQQLFLPIFSLIVVLLINLIKDPGFFQIGLQNGVLYGRLIDILNRGSEIAILAVGQTLVVAVSAGTDISVGSVMSLTACGTCMMLAGYGNNSVNELAVPMGVGILFGLVMMLVLPHLMPMVHAAAVTSITGGFLSAALILKYRDKLRPRFVLITAVPYMIASVIMLQFVQRINTRTMAILFGAFLTVIGLYYLIWSHKARLRITPVTMLVCPVVSGLSSALFGIGGPLMSLMYLEKYETREEYSTNLQLLFLIAAVINTATRTAKGIITASLLPAMAAGIAAILVGEKVGLLLASRMKPDFLRKMVYVMVFFSGVITVINNL